MWGKDEGFNWTLGEDPTPAFILSSAIVLIGLELVYCFVFFFDGEYKLLSRLNYINLFWFSKVMLRLELCFLWLSNPPLFSIWFWP